MNEDWKKPITPPRGASDQLTDEEKRDRRYLHRFPNAVHPRCPWCEIPHPPMAVDYENDDPGGTYVNGVDQCNAAEAVLDIEDLGRIDARLREVLRLIDWDAHGGGIASEQQGERWHFMTETFWNPKERNQYHGAASLELMKRLQRIEREVTVARGMVALISNSLAKEAAGYVAPELGLLEKAEAAMREKMAKDGPEST